MDRQSGRFIRWVIFFREGFEVSKDFSFVCIFYSFLGFILFKIYNILFLNVVFKYKNEKNYLTMFSILSLKDSDYNVYF